MSLFDVAVAGLGYVGLPLAREAVRAGLRVAGYDPSAQRVADLRAGRSHVDDVNEQEMADLLAGGFHATADADCFADADAVIVCVPTPLNAGSPDLGAVTNAAELIEARLSRGMLVVLESTSYPGTTDEAVQPILERSGLVAGVDFHLAYSPERIDPGNARYGVRNTPKVVGGVTPACTEAAATFYGKLVDTVVRAAGAREAEMAKLLENTYRHINIALVNEMAVFCDELGIDLWDAIAAAATKPFGFEPFYPGPGVGGHCIPIDPNYLSYKVRTLGYPFRFVELAQEINARMPAYVAQRIQRMLNDQAKPVRGSRVVLLGVTYKANVSDEREAPARPLARRLLELGADLAYHDPYVPSWGVDGRPIPRVTDVDEGLADADLVVLLQHHGDYDLDALARSGHAVLDTRGKLAGEGIERL